MDLTKLEAAAELLYARAGLDPSDPVVPVHLAGEIWGWENILEDPTLTTVASFDGKCLRLRATANPSEHDWFAAREIARWCLGLFRTTWTEAALDTLAACLRTPRVAFAPLAQRIGPAFPELSSAFTISESAAALRFGEVVGTKIALFAPGKPVRVRGNLGRSTRPRTLRLLDAPGRFVRVFAA